jgi:2-dehydropantoate 2-reductase
MKITILGTGAMACLFGARLAHLADVTLLGTWREAIDAIRKDGIRLETAEGATTVKIAATDNPADCANSDLVLVLTKANRTQAAVERADSILREDGLALTFQNGLGNVEILREVFGPERAAGGSAVLGAYLIAPGVVRSSGEAAVWVEQHPRALPAIELLASAGFETHLAPDLDAILWAKLVANAAINPLSALLRMPNGELVEREKVRLTLEAVARETAGIAAALGITLPFDDPAAYVVDVARRTASNHSSMLQDIEAGRETEVDAINGAVIAAAGRAGLLAPWNINMLQMIKAAEKAGRS